MYILIRSCLILGLALLGVFIKNIPKICPTRFGNQNRVPKIPFHLGNGDVSTLSVLFASEKEIFVFDPQVSGLRSRCSFLNLSIVILFNKFFQMMVELLHPIGWDEDLETRIASRKRFRDFQKSTSSVFLK